MKALLERYRDFYDSPGNSDNRPTVDEINDLLEDIEDHQHFVGNKGE